MFGGYLLLNLSLPHFISRVTEGVEKETLIWINLILIILLLAALAPRIPKLLIALQSFHFSRLFRKVKLEIKLEKDRPLRPQVLTLTIRNAGKNTADIDAPVLEYRKIWSRRKFKLNGISGNQIYPMYIDPGKTHQLRIETSTFHHYDRTIKTYYRARVFLTDIDGRKWKSNTVILRKSLVT